ncbi:futalosine hydrolase [Olivibacter sp. XZL3]|uniref:futalosine hydrolase n=1 Tax=Olivibacter sp. XZL3 TaxID=1735116 RepID=UPI0010653CAB|nr:futalosine hydrolase [Olivibacter sp. XZL3]
MGTCLVVAATAAEIEPFVRAMEGQQKKADVLITGVGMVATAFSLGSVLGRKTYDYAINVGICGAFSKELPLGALTFVERDTFYELGAEDDQQFLSIEDLGFGKASYQAISGFPSKEISALRKATGLTVNSVHGNEASIALAVARTGADVESMEGAAFYYACEQAGLPCAQIRSVSNYVERRDRNKWKIGLAVANLNEWLISYFGSD